MWAADTCVKNKQARIYFNKVMNMNAGNNTEHAMQTYGHTT
jgi:hypothetical protein